MADDAVLWVYGVVPGAAPPPAGIAGLEGRPVEAVAEGGLAALTSAVPPDRFGAAELQRRLEDLPTLEELARAHERVLDAALRQGDVIPFRMCTIYASERAVRDMLAAEAGRFAGALAALRDTAEWGVKAFAERREAVAAWERPASGAEYLARRREERRLAEHGSEALETAAAEVHRALAAAAVAAVLARPHDRRLSGQSAEMVLNGAYLVPRDGAGDFAGLVDALRLHHEEAGLVLELTGPWPPYHFVAERPE